jgi:uncharacterized membrane protein YeaQ/YmgE (transglycosylase-associated protein family)
MDDPTPDARRTTPPIYAEQVVVPPQPPQPTNTEGIYAFVFSLLGVTFLPVIGSVVGLVLGIIAARREPNGLALAAIVISLFGGCIGGFLLAVFALPLLALSISNLGRATVTLPTAVDATPTGEAVEQFRTDNGRLPTSLEEIYGIGNVPTDETGTPLRLRVKLLEFGDQFEIQAIGDDQQWDTGDDRTLYTTTTF